MCLQLTPSAEWKSNTRDLCPTGQQTDHNGNTLKYGFPSLSDTTRCGCAQNCRCDNTVVTALRVLTSDEFVWRVLGLGLFPTCALLDNGILPRDHTFATTQRTVGFPIHSEVTGAQRLSERALTIASSSIFTSLIPLSDMLKCSAEPLH
jgi:hypothetical protein